MPKAKFSRPFVAVFSCCVSIALIATTLPASVCAQTRAPAVRDALAPASLFSSFTFYRGPEDKEAAATAVQTIVKKKAYEDVDEGELDLKVNAFAKKLININYKCDRHFWLRPLAHLGSCYSEGSA